jgi:serine protease Do
MKMMKKNKRSHNGLIFRSRFSLLLLVSFFVFLAAGSLVSCSRKDKQAMKEKKTPKAVSSQIGVTPDVAQSQNTASWEAAIEQVARKAIPTVVHIEVTEYQQVVNPMVPFENNPFFDQFFGTPKGPRKFKRELKGVGSGIIMDAQGHILTNNHVAGGASKIEVLLSNGGHYPAKLVGTDPKTDLAVIKISAGKPLPFASFGDSDQVQVGQWVVAIGQPLGLNQTVTQGIISAKHRNNILNPSSYEDFLQTDAAINPGNSGGPLLNLKGEVVGINSAIMSKSGGFEGIGFSIPSNMAIHVAKELIAHGKVVRGWLGVSIQNLTPALAESFGAKGVDGALIADVVKKGPGDTAGLKRGDIVLSFGGKPIKDADTLRNEVAAAPVGKETEFTVFRDGKRLERKVKIGNLENATKFFSRVVKERLGVTVRPVTKKETQKYALHPQQGVAVAGVDPKGPLGSAGFEVGDIILQINRYAITSMQDLDSIVSATGPHQRIVIFALDHRTGNRAALRVSLR